MVLDEAQFIKSSSSARWKSLLSFKCRNRLLLTGTPIQNSMAEVKKNHFFRLNPLIFFIVMGIITFYYAYSF